MNTGPVAPTGPGVLPLDPPSRVRALGALGLCFSPEKENLRIGPAVLLAAGSAKRQPKTAMLVEVASSLSAVDRAKLAESVLLPGLPKATSDKLQGSNGRSSTSAVEDLASCTVTPEITPRKLQQASTSSDHITEHDAAPAVVHVKSSPVHSSEVLEKRHIDCDRVEIDPTTISSMPDKKRLANMSIAATSFIPLVESPALHGAIDKVTITPSVEPNRGTEDLPRSAAVDLFQAATGAPPTEATQFLIAAFLEEPKLEERRTRLSNLRKRISNLRLLIREAAEREQQLAASGTKVDKAPRSVSACASAGSSHSTWASESVAVKASVKSTMAVPPPPPPTAASEPAAVPKLSDLGSIAAACISTAESMEVLNQAMDALETVIAQWNLADSPSSGAMCKPDSEAVCELSARVSAVPAGHFDDTVVELLNEVDQTSLDFLRHSKRVAKSSLCAQPVEDRAAASVDSVLAEAATTDNFSALCSVDEMTCLKFAGAAGKDPQVKSALVDKLMVTSGQLVGLTSSAAKVIVSEAYSALLCLCAVVADSELLFLLSTAGAAVILQWFLCIRLFG